VSWDRDRPVPWKRLFTFVGIYSLVVFGLFAVLKPGEILGSLPGLVFGAVVAVGVMAVLSKFGWQPTMLKTKAQIAEARAEREAARASSPRASKRADAAASDASSAPRAKPAPTKRTTTGPTNNPRRTRDTRKR
jgi:hypothetical protein